jgi:hypothetical protein
MKLEKLGCGAERSVPRWGGMARGNATFLTALWRGARVGM